MMGKVLFYDARGYGFIQPVAEDAPDIYFHRSALVGVLNRRICKDLLVQFDIGERQRKPIAVNVRMMPEHTLGDVLSGRAARAE